MGIKTENPLQLEKEKWNETIRLMSLCHPGP